MNASTSLTDQFLIAMPQLEDPNFSRSVSYICEHSEGGALGITINRPIDLTVAQMLDEIDIEVKNEALAEKQVYMGGPVYPNRGFILHTGDDHWESSLAVTDNISLTTSRDILEAIALGEGPGQILVALGYAGWDQGQLEHEILQNAWLTGPADHDIIFNVAAEMRWSRAVEKLGVDLTQLSGDAGHA